MWLKLFRFKHNPLTKFDLNAQQHCFHQPRHLGNKWTSPNNLQPRSSTFFNLEQFTNLSIQPEICCQHSHKLFTYIVVSECMHLQTCHLTLLQSGKEPDTVTRHYCNLCFKLLLLSPEQMLNLLEVNLACTLQSITNKPIMHKLCGWCTLSKSETFTESSNADLIGNSLTSTRQTLQMSSLAISLWTSPYAFQRNGYTPQNKHPP